MTSSDHKSPLKVILIYLGLAIGAIIVFLSLPGCTDTCNTTTTYTTYQAQYSSMSELRTQVGILPPQEREGQGKIYVYESYLLLGDPDRGIHIYNNADQTDPRAVSFINIPGNKDMAVRNNRLYADSYVDLLIFDLSDPENIVLVKREENVFPLYNEIFGFAGSTDQVIVDMIEVEEIQMSTDCSSQGGGLIMIAEDMVAMPATGTQNLAAGPKVGTGGSMARFTIVENTLYAVDNTSMYILDLTNGDNPIITNTIGLGWGIETIFPFRNNLFIGSISGMSIYNIDDPQNPQYMSEVNHIRTCDPVVANDEYAFVTLRAENENQVCGATFTNQLDVIDISNLMDARLLHSYNMTSPHGLGLDGNILFVTEGDEGLKIFDISDVAKLNENLLHHITGFNAFDVIPVNGTLILTGRDGLYQFDYTNIDEIRMLSLIPSATTL